MYLGSLLFVVKAKAVVAIAPTRRILKKVLMCCVFLGVQIYNSQKELALRKPNITGLWSRIGYIC
jgi:hypothetical protein